MCGELIKLVVLGDNVTYLHIQNNNYIVQQEEEESEVLQQSENYDLEPFAESSDEENDEDDLEEEKEMEKLRNSAGVYNSNKTKARKRAGDHIYPFRQVMVPTEYNNEEEELEWSDSNSSVHGDEPYEDDSDLSDDSRTPKKRKEKKAKIKPIKQQGKTTRQATKLHNNYNSIDKVRIVSQNVARSAENMDALFHVIEGQNYAFVCIQEPPPKNSQSKDWECYIPQIMGDRWSLIIPGDRDNWHKDKKWVRGRARTAIFVNNKINTFAYNDMSTTFAMGGDAISIEIRVNNNDRFKLYNMYAPHKDTNFFTRLKKAMDNNSEEEVLLVGDWNIRHINWQPSYTGPVTRACTLAVSMTEKLNLIQITPPGEVTRKGPNTRAVVGDAGEIESTIDLVFASRTISELVTSCTCETIGWAAGSDHAAVDIALNLKDWNSSMDSDTRRKYNIKRIDIHRFKCAFDTSWLSSHALQLPEVELNSNSAAIDAFTEALTAAITNALDSSCPTTVTKTKPSPCWTGAVNAAMAQKKKLTNATLKAKKKLDNAISTGIHRDIERFSKKYTRIRQECKNSISTFKATFKKARIEYQQGLLETINATNLYKVCDKVQGKSKGKTRLVFPMKGDGVDGTAKTFKECTKGFERTFFAPLENDDGIFSYDEIPESSQSRFEWNYHSAEDLKKILMTRNMDSAPGEDSITNKMLVATWSVIGIHVQKLFKACLSAGYHPERWKSAFVNIIRKPGKPDYSKFGAYRPISILNCLSKLLEKAVADELLYCLEDTLPIQHMGNRNCRGTEQAVLAAIDFIKAEQAKGRDVVGLLLDASQAFNKVRKKEMLQALASMQVPIPIIRWIDSFLSDRKGVIQINGDKGDSFDIKGGIPQGSPISSILYIIYNSALIQEMNKDVQMFSYRNPATNETTSLGKNQLCIGYADDSLILVSMERDKHSTRKFCTSKDRYLDLAKEGRNTRERLHEFLQHKVDMAVEWAESTGTKFEHDKASLIYFKGKYNSQNVYDDDGNFLHTTVDKDPDADKDSTQYKITLYGEEIVPKTSIKYLGVHLDAKLTFEHHVNETVKKATTTVNSLYPATKKLSIFWAQRILTVAVDPIIHYCLLAWWPLAYNSPGIKAAIQKVHNLTLRRICGARMSCPINALEVELDIPPPEARRKYLLSCAVNRMKTYQNCLESSHLIGYLRCLRKRTDVSSPVPGTVAHLLDLTPFDLTYPPDTDLKLMKNNRIWQVEWTPNFRADDDYEPAAGKYLYAIDHVTTPIERLKRYKQLSRKQGRNILHLRVGHTTLLESRRRVYNMVTDPIACRYCECEDTVESAEHVLLHCTKFDALRGQILHPFTARSMSELLSSNDSIMAIATYIDKARIKIYRKKKEKPKEEEKEAIEEEVGD